MKEFIVKSFYFFLIIYSTCLNAGCGFFRSGYTYGHLADPVAESAKPAAPLIDGLWRNRQVLYIQDLAVFIQKCPSISEAQARDIIAQLKKEDGVLLQTGERLKLGCFSTYEREKINVVQLDRALKELQKRENTPSCKLFKELFQESKEHAVEFARKQEESRSRRGDEKFYDNSRRTLLLTAVMH